ncbi:histidine kinase dimerization/phosphoacceptor domain-containing protein [Streptomyces sp. NPDC048192]|uniref:histidine kinase dimerization/phosphoacceptor domain-containing protein n=1 Tax=Streptomyces sp. NPDC048192 TaxID=3365510 RepID=UPI00371273FB
MPLARVRRRYRWILEDRRWLLERERETAARTAVAAERARIARALHDIVSHKISLMVVQATAAREVLAVLPDPAETALEAVEGAGRDAMTELRPLLGLLAPSPEATTPPGTAKGTCPGSHRSRARADSAPLSTGSRSPACRPRCASPVNRDR